MDETRPVDVSGGGTADMSTEQVLRARAGIDGRVIPLSGVIPGVVSETSSEFALVDGHGVVILSVDTVTGSVRGASADTTWTALLADGRTREIPNPLHRTEELVHAVARSLRQREVCLDERYYDFLAVFPAARTHGLELASIDAARVVDDPGLATFLDARALANDVGPALQPVAIEVIAETLRTLRVQPSAATAPVVPQPVGTPSRRRSAVTAAVLIGALLAALIGVMMLVVPSEEPAPTARSSTPQPVSGGTAANTSPTPPPISPTEEQPSGPQIDYDPSTAMDRIEEERPGIHDAITDADSPLFERHETYATYTFTYVSHTSGGGVTTGTYSISLDADGEVVKPKKD